MRRMLTVALVGSAAAAAAACGSAQHPRATRARLQLYDLEAALVRGPTKTRPRHRPRTTIVSCGRFAAICPGVPRIRPKKTRYYVFWLPPAMTNADVARTRFDLDPATRQAVVLIEFTHLGAQKFTTMTAREAARGRVKGTPQHLAIVVDRRLMSFPSIDYLQYPHGLTGASGIQISGLRGLREAKQLAQALQPPGRGA